MPNERYIYDILHKTIVDNQSDQPHDLEKLKKIFLELRKLGKFDAELIAIFRDSFNLTAEEATALLQQIKGYGSDIDPDTDPAEDKPKVKTEEDEPGSP